MYPPEKMRGGKQYIAFAQSPLKSPYGHKTNRPANDQWPQQKR
jgi:hypothetical protein